MILLHFCHKFYKRSPFYSNYSNSINSSRQLGWNQFFCRILLTSELCSWAKLDRQCNSQSKVTTKVKSAEIWVKTQRALLNHQESDVRPGCSANPQTTALGGKYRQHLGAFPRVCGFKGTWGIGNRWMANLTWQCYRVGGHSRQFPLPSALRSTQLHYRRRLRIVLLCECSHQGGRDGECLMRGGGGSREGRGSQQEDNLL